MQAFEATPPPLTKDTDGVVRASGSRVPLEILVFAFDSGATAEEIAQQYPSLDLATVYAIIAYVLDNRESVDAYVATRRGAAVAQQATIEAYLPPSGIRARLLARRRRPTAG